MYFSRFSCLNFSFMQKISFDAHELFNIKLIFFVTFSISLQMIDYALKGSFDMMDASPDALDDFILCIREFRPRGFWTLIHHITDGLRNKLNEVSLSFFFFFSSFK